MVQVDILRVLLRVVKLTKKAILSNDIIFVEIRPKWSHGKENIVKIKRRRKT